VVLPAELATPLRTGALPVVGRVHHGRLHLDLVAVDPEQDDVLVDAVRAVVRADPGLVGG
jgi:L-seryl-tRNA(Ser) seleniumtransferase